VSRRPAPAGHATPVMQATPDRDGRASSRADRTIHRMQHENLWAPWRMAYLRELERNAAAVGEPPADATAGNFLAAYWNDPAGDTEHLVIHRGARGLILLNRYPYAGGHLLVALGDPRPTLLDYEPEQRAELWRLVELASDLMQRALNPQGINIGINQGRAAGAGLPEHLHVHLVPRWNADTNFITTVADVRVIPESLERMLETYRRHLPAVLEDAAAGAAGT
jgi:ATP adenylyltransferase